MARLLTGRRWIIGLGLVVGLAAGLYWLIALAGADERFSRTQYDSIRLGMGMHEVEAILGCPPGNVGSPGTRYVCVDRVAPDAFEAHRHYAPRHHQYSWTDGQRSIHVIALGKKVIGKACFSREASWKQLFPRIEASPLMPELPWHKATGEQPVTVMRRHMSSVTTLAFSPDGKLLASGSMDETARLWDVTTGCELVRFNDHEGTVTAVAFTTDGHTLVTAAQDNTVRLWDVVGGRLRATLPGSEQSRIVLSPDGRSVGVLHYEFAPGSDWLVATHLDLWDVATGQKHMELHLDKAYIDPAVFSPDGMMLATDCVEEEPAQGNKPIRRKRAFRLWDLRDQRERVRASGGEHGNHAVAFQPDGKAVAWVDGRVVRLCDTESGKELRRFTGHPYEIDHLEFSPDGRVLAACEAYVSFWDVATGKLIGRVPETMSAPIWLVAFTPDGLPVAKGAAALYCGQCSQSGGVSMRGVRLQMDAPDMGLGVFSPDRTLFAGVEQDDTIKIWRVPR
jgi:WD40 repeat protein